MKICSTCKLEKGELEFNGNGNSEDKLRKSCRLCEHFNRNGDILVDPKILPKDKYSYALNKSSIMEFARSQSTQAIAKGDIKRQPCEICGSEEKVNAHHDDYNYPLSVRWFCASHHGLWHSSHGRARNPYDLKMLTIYVLLKDIEVARHEVDKLKAINTIYEAERSGKYIFVKTDENRDIESDIARAEDSGL